jgi:tripartite-type tricarboxylate transporter receptor subunit TctC
MRRRNVRRGAVLLPVVGLLAAACGGDSNDSNGNTASGDGGASSESCYEGETATFVVPFSPGGGYDVIARGMQPFLEEELGADAVVVENQTGAGGLTAANALFTAEPDGLTFGLFAAQGILGSALAGAAGVSYDPEQFTYVARLAEDDRALTASPQSGITSVEDLLEYGEYQYATAGVGASDHIDANVVPTILGIEKDIDIVTGFEGSSETALAVTAGEVEIGSGTLGTRMNGINAGDQIPILLMGRERNDLIPDVPALLELDLENPDLAEAYIGLQEVGRSVLAPPAMEEGCLTELQNAIQGTLENADFLESVADNLDEPFEYTDGDGLREAVDSVLGAPEELVQLLKNAYADQ